MHEAKLRAAARSLSTAVFTKGTDVELLRAEAFRIATAEGVQCEVDDFRLTVRFTRGQGSRGRFGANRSS